MHICHQCASTQETCCQKGWDVVLTQGDIERMRRVLVHADFVEYRPVIDPEDLNEDGDPNWLLYTLRTDLSRRVVKHDPVKRKCMFLTPSGCQLAVGTRPIVCRLYPFRYNEQDISGFCSTTCPIRFLPPGISIIDALGMSYTEAQKLRTLLYAELRQEWNESHARTKSA